MICVDASVAAKWILDEPFADNAVALLRDSARSASPIVAPPLLPFEITNILRQRMVRFRMAMQVADTLLAAFLEIPIALELTSNLYRQALAIADGFGLPAAYDAQYVALAQSFGCDLWTDDQQLLDILNNRLPFVRWIGDYAPNPPASESV
jgi:predicted nucleic acid-binding protein